MAKYSQTVEYNLRTSLDASGITKLQTELNKVRATIQEMGSGKEELFGFDIALKNITKIQSLLNKSYNSRIGMLDLSAFNKGLKESNLSLVDMRASFKLAGNQGQQAFTQMLGRLGQLDTGLKATSSTMDKIFNTVGNTVRWGIVASGFNMIKASMQDSIKYVKELDNSLTQIMLVTDYSRKQMNDYAKSANEAAKAVGLTTTPMTNGTLVFAQQGFNLKDSAQLATLSAKLANASEQDTKDTSDQITAIMNAYNLSGDVEKLHAALDSWAKVANVSAADVAEIAGAAQRVASTAAATNVTMDQLNAQIATIETVTREAPEQIGNGLKTLYGRFSDIKLGKTLEDGVDLGKVTKVLDKVGVQVLNGDGKLRGVGDIMEDLMAVWKSIDSTQKAAIAQTVAGKFQLSRFEALMNRGDLYGQYKNASETASGTLDQMNEEAVNSLAGKSKQIMNNVEGITAALFNTDDVYPVLDGVRDLLGLTKEFIDTLGGGKTIMLGAYSLMTKMFSSQMSAGIANVIKNMNLAQTIQNNNRMALQQAQEMGLLSPDLNSSDYENYYDNLDNPHLEKVLDFMRFGVKNRSTFSTEEMENYTAELNKTVALEQERLQILEKMSTLKDVSNLIYGGDIITRDKESGNLKFSDTYDQVGDIFGPSLLYDNSAIEMQRSHSAAAYNSIANIRESMAEIFSNMRVTGELDAEALQVQEGELQKIEKNYQNILNLVSAIDDEYSDNHYLTLAEQETDELAESVSQTEDPLDRLIIRINQLKDLFEDMKTEGLDFFDGQYAEQIVADSIGQSDILLKGLQQAKEDSKVVFARRNSDLTGLNDRNLHNEAGRISQEGVNEGLEEETALRHRIQSTIQLSSAIGQLGFAWSAFQNLGSLWANDNTTDGEKVLQTVINLSMAVPNMVSAFRGFNTKSLKDAQQTFASIGEFVKGKAVAGFSSMVDGAKEFISNFSKAPEQFRNAQRAASLFSESMESSRVATAGIALSLNTILPGLFIIAAVGSVIANTVREQQEAVSRATIQAGETATGDFNKIREAKQAYIEMYQKYKEGKASSDELKKASESLNKALGSQADTLSTANGQWETYNRNIERASEVKLDEVIRTQNTALNEAGRKFAETAGPFSSISAQWAPDSKFAGGNQAVTEAYKNSSSLTMSSITGDWKFVNSTSAAQRVQDIQRVDEAFNKAIESERALGHDVEILVEQQKKLHELRDSHPEELNQYQTASQNLTASLTDKYSSDNAPVQYQKGETIEQYRNRLVEDLQKKGYVTGQDEAEAVADGMVKGVSKVTSNVQWIKDLAQQQVFEDANKKYDKLSDEQKAAVAKGFNNFAPGYDKDKYAQLMASIDEDSSVENIQNQLKRIKSLIPEEDKTIQLKTDYKDAYKETNGAVNQLDSIWSQYDKDESGGFDNQEAAKLLAEHPEYAGYLTKVGDQYKLNQQALDDWNESIKEQNQLVDDNMGGTQSFENYRDILASVQSKNSHQNTHDYGIGNSTEGIVEEQTNFQNIDSQLDALVNKNEELNQSLAEGSISTQEYFASMSSSIESSGLYDALDSLNGKFDATTDYAEEMVSVLGAEVSDALVQSNKRFVQGKESVSDYIKDLQGGIEIQKRLTASTYDLQESEDGLYEAVDKNNQAAVNAADSLNALTRTQKELSAALEISDTLGQNAEMLEQYTDAAGQLTDGILDDSRFTDYMNSLTQSLVDFAATSQDNFAAISESLANIANVSVDEMNSLLTAAINGSAEESAAAMAQIVDMTGMSADQVSQMTQLAMNSTSGALMNAQQAIGQVLTALGNMIKSFNYTIEFEPFIKGPANGKWIDIENGKINLPTFGFNAKGKGGGNVASFAAALTNAGSYFTNAGNTAARAQAISAYKPVGNNAVGQGARGAGYGGSGKGKGGGGGGKGGGSGKSYEPKTKDLEKDEVDRYERVNALLSAVGEDLSVIQKEEKRLTGKELLKNLESQIPLLQKQILLYREKLKIQKQEASELRDQLQSQYGLAFDTEGFIANYQQVHDELLNRVNNLIGQYNATTTEEGQKDLDKQIQSAKKELDDFNKTYKRYDTLWSKDLKDTQKQIEDITDSIEDLQIEAFNKSVKALDNIKDIQKTLETFQHNMNRGLDKNPFEDLAESGAKLQKYFDIKTADKYFDEMIKNYSRLQQKATEQSAKDFYQRKIDEVKAGRSAQGNGSMEAGGTGYFDMAWQNGSEILNQLKQYEETGQSEIFGENGKGLYDSAKDIFNQMSKLLEDYWSDIDDVHNKIIEAISDISDRIEKRKNQYSAIADELEHIADISELLHGDKAYEEQNRILAAQQTNYRAQLAEYQQQLAIWKEMQSHMRQGSEEWNTVQEKITAATKDIDDLIKTSLENLHKQYSNAISKITDSWSGNAMGNDLEWIKTEWELINRNADYYLDATNKAYNIQKLQGKYLDLLDGTNDLKVQQMITDQMKDQLGYLRNKTNLSSYDVQYAQAQLEILQKRIALEDAQNNKTQMKLRRDSQGNYSYVYTANQNNTRAAQGDLLDAQNNAYNLSKEQMKQTQSDSLSALTEAKSQVDDIWNNANLSLDEKKKRTQTIIDSLKEYLASTGEQLSTSEKNIINDYIGMFNAMTEENRSGMKDVYDQIVQGNNDAFDQIDTRWATSITNWLQNLADFNTNTDGMFNSLIDTAENYKEQTEDVANAVGRDFDNITQSLNNCVDSTKELSNSTADFIQQLKNDSGVVQDYEHRIESMAGKVVNANNSMRAYNQQVNDLGNKLTAKEQENANLLSQNQNLQGQIDEWTRQQNGGGAGGAGGNGAGGAGGSGSGNDATAWGIAQAIWTYGWQSGWGNDPIRSGKLKGAYGSDFARKVQDYINQYWQSGKLVNYNSLGYSSYNLIGYDTGGYTGSWNNSSDGRVALLHQKELVLNADDTKNILGAVQAVRSFANAMKVDAINNILGAFGNAINGMTSVGVDNNIKQDVHITAEFPNATSTKEIEDAILGLNDRSWQYAFGK